MRLHITFVAFVLYGWASLILTDKNDSAVIREFAIFQRYVFLKLIWFLYKKEPFVLRFVL